MDRFEQSEAQWKREVFMFGLSIPVMASLRIVFRRWRLYAEKKKFGPLSEYPFRAQETHRP